MQLFRVTLKQEAGYYNLLTISYIFDGKPIPKTSLITAGTVPDVKVPETTVNLKEIPKIEAVKTEPMESSSYARIVIIKPTIPTPVEQKDVVIYRVQFLTSSRPRVNNEIIVGGKSYKIFEYFYLGAYRYTIGEFRTLSPAIELQRICRQTGYPQAFVAAFKNNTRSLDLILFK